jgi:hypothetical protein
VFDAEGNLTHGSLAQIGHMLTAWATLDDLRPGLTMAYQVGFFALPLVVVQVVQYRSRDMMIMTRLPVVPRGIWYGLLVAGIFVLGAREPVEFIYFQF